uniref:Muscarinic acetylcholine receptor n=1 Tax=Kryptolebias marmoratus TaxID=37003 RepID=A0A3Q3APN6_KRYMA
MSEEQSDSNSTGYYFDNPSTRVQHSFVFSGPMFVILMVMMVTLVVVIVLGNALVILAFKVDKSLRRQCNYYFLNLAISDFLVGAFCIPVYIPYILTGRWTLGRGLCKLWLVIDYLLCSASVFSIVLISYDRFLSVTRAVSYRARQSMTHQAIIKMIAVWVLAFVLYGPAIIFWELVVGRSRGTAAGNRPLPPPSRSLSAHCVVFCVVCVGVCVRGGGQQRTFDQRDAGTFPWG